MELLIVFLIGLSASFFGSFSSGTVSILALTGLLATGMTPLVAFGVYRMGSFGLDLGGIYEYFKAKQIVWKMVPALTIIGVVASLVGARLIISIDEQVAKIAVGFIAIVFLPLLFLRPTAGVKSSSVGKVKKYWGYVVYGLATLWGSSFSIGVGMLITLTYIFLFGKTILQAKATGKIPGVFANLAALAVFYYYGHLDLTLGLFHMLGMFIGATFATRTMLKLGNGWLRYILVGTILLLSLKLILEL